MNRYLASLLYMTLVYSEKLIPDNTSEKIKKSLLFSNIVKSYNLFQICFNSFIVFKIIIGYSSVPWNGEIYHFIERCLGLVHSKMSWQTHCINLYLIAKYIDWVDTAIIVIKKSKKQLSWLHCVHHVIMPYPFHYWLNAIPDKAGIYMHQLLINSFVHVLMYSYYLFAPLYPSLRKYKLLLTEFQLLQFYSCIMVAIMSVVYEEFTMEAFGVYMSISTLLINMFGNFYKRELSRNKEYITTKKLIGLESSQKNKIQ